MAARPRLTVHIGAPKCGSTTLQRFVNRNGAALQAAGVATPGIPGFNGQALLHAMARDPARAGVAELDHGELADPGRNARVAAAADLFVAACRAEAAAGRDRILLSREHLASRLDRAGEIARFADILRAMDPAEIRVLVVLRRQAAILPSIQAELIAIGSRRDRLPDTDRVEAWRRFEEESQTPRAGGLGVDRLLRWWLRYDRLLGAWAAALPEATITPVVFETAVRGGLCRSVFGAADLPWLDSFVEPEAERRSAGTRGLAAQSLYNTLAPRVVGGRPGRFWRRGVSLRLGRLGGPPLRLTAAQERGVTALYADSNAELARRWLNGASLPW